MKDYKVIIECKDGETRIEVCGGQVDIAYGLCEAMRRSKDLKELVGAALFVLDTEPEDGRE